MNEPLDLTERLKALQAKVSPPVVISSQAPDRMSVLHDILQATLAGCSAMADHIERLEKRIEAMEKDAPWEK